MAVESNIEGLWAARQTAKGSPAADATKRFRKVGGDLSGERTDGEENFSDLDRFGDAADFIDTIIGGGSPVIQAQAAEVAWLFWLFCGGETFTAAAAGISPPKHVFVPGTNTGYWSTWWKRVGLSSPIIRRRFNDCKITAVRLEASSQNKICKVTPTIVSLDPDEIAAADPASPVSMDQIEPLLFTEAQGTITIDGTVYRGSSQFAGVLDSAETSWYGDDVKPHDLVAGNASAALDGITLLLDADSLAFYNAQVYGSANPAANTKPAETLPPLGSYSIEFKRGAADQRISIKVEVPGVKWTFPPAIAGNPDGGPVEIPFAGKMRKVTGQPAWRVTVETGTADNAAYT